MLLKDTQSHQSKSTLEQISLTEEREREYAFVLLSSAVVVRASDGKCIGHWAKAKAAAASSACDVPAMISDGRREVNADDAD